MIVLFLDLIIAFFSIGVWVLIYWQTQAKGVLLIIIFMALFNIHILRSSFKKEEESESEEREI